MGAYGSPELSPKPPVNDTYVSDYPKVTYKQHWGIPWLSVLRVFLWCIIVYLIFFISLGLLVAYGTVFFGW